jgi:hypothetical protein
VLARVCRAAWRLEQAERERVWALVSARAEGFRFASWPRRPGCRRHGVHQLVAAADLDALDAALGELRAAGWPTPAAERTSEYAAWLLGQLLQTARRPARPRPGQRARLVDR